MDLDEIIEFSAKDAAPEPEAALVDMEFTEEVQRQLNALNEKDRAVLVLRYWHEYKEKEIGQILSISTGAVKSRLHRARQRMAQQWASKCESKCPENKILHAQMI